jgi:hypothetical protein
MKTMALGSVLILLFLVCGADPSLSSSPVAGESQDAFSLLPAAEEIEGWQKAPPPVIYTDEELYDYIDGGAEIFFDYGFKQVLVQEFEKGTMRIALEVYEMASADAARGIFTHRASTGEKQVSIGQEGRLGDDYLTFHDGPYFVSVTGMETGPEISRGVQTIARAVADRIKSQR